MTPQEVKVFAASMAKRCKVTIIGKSQVSWTIKMFRKYILRRFSKYMPDLQDEFRPCCFRFLGREFVVLTFDIGCEKIPPLKQAEVITHECQHAFDYRKYSREQGEKWTNWLRNYLLNDTFRAWAEGTPCTAEAEFHYRVHGVYRTPVCDFGAYLIDDESALRAFRGGCETRRRAVLKQGDEWIPTQKAASIAIDIYDDIVRAS